MHFWLKRVIGLEGLRFTCDFMFFIQCRADISYETAYILSFLARVSPKSSEDAAMQLLSLFSKKTKTAPDGNLKSELVMLYYKAAAEEYGTDIA